MKGYEGLFKSQNNDIIGNLSFNDLVSSKSGRYKINRLFQYLKKNGFDVSGYWVREKSKVGNIHYHFVMKLDEKKDKEELKNMIFKFWKYNGSCVVKNYKSEIGTFEKYMTKSMSYNDFDWDFI